MANPCYSADGLTQSKLDVTFSATGGTVTGSHVIELQYLAASFPSKNDLLQAVDAIRQAIVEETYPAA